MVEGPSPSSSPPAPPGLPREVSKDPSRTYQLNQDIEKYISEKRSRHAESGAESDSDSAGSDDGGAHEGNLSTEELQAPAEPEFPRMLNGRIPRRTVGRCFSRERGSALGRSAARPLCGLGLPSR
jgi:hypothetical protein